MNHFVCAALLVAAAALPADAADRFEVLAWVDHFDFAGPRQGDAYRFDTETPEGCARIVDHVQEVGATTILWRNCGGANMRYQSAAESHHHASILDKRIVFDNRVPHGWVRYGEADPDILRTVTRMCGERGLRPGVHWPFEETHWAIWTIGGWNLEHPKYWGRTIDGRPWWGRGSLASSLVVEHKLALLDELIDRGVEVVFIDFFRTGGWSPAYEYVPPIVDRYRDIYGVDPPVDPRDPRWCRLVSTYVAELLRQTRARMDASGRKTDLLVGIPNIAPLGDQTVIAGGADWQGWIDEGLIDGLVINYVTWDAERPFESTRELSRDVMRIVDGRCPVYWPVRAYDYSGNGMPSYMKATGLTQAEIAARLTQMAWEEGAAGISLECVDYNNYALDTREALRSLAEGPCKWVRTEAQEGE